MILVEVSLLCLNCKGAGRKDFLCKMKDHMREQWPKVIILLEPKISGDVAMRFAGNWGRSSGFVQRPTASMEEYG